MMQVVVGREKWNEFSIKLNNKTSIKWQSNEEIIEFNPFKNRNIDYCILVCLVDENNDNIPYFILRETIQKFSTEETIKILEQNQFIETCELLYPKK